MSATWIRTSRTHRLARAIAVASAAWLIAGCDDSTNGPPRMGSIYRDATYGFSIEPLEPPAPKTQAVAIQTQRLIMLLPPEKGFSSNINVMILPQETTRDAYIDVSKKELEALSATLLAEESLTVTGRDAVLLEYEMELSGRELHFLALSVIETDRVLLITCTAPKATFAKYEANFRKSLKSFLLEPRISGE